MRRHLQLVPLVRAVSVVASLVLSAGPAAAFQVEGRVIDPAGSALAGARVELAPLPSNHAWAAGLLAGRVAPEPVVEAVAGEDGRYHVAVPEPGVWSLTVAAPGRVPMRLAPLPVTGDRVLPDAVLWPAEPVRVRVVDSTGAPVAGVWVRASSAGPAPWDGAEDWRPGARIGRTGDGGAVTLPRGAGERLEVHALPAASLAAVSAQGQGDLVLRLPPPGGQRTLRVVGMDGRPLAGIVVSRRSLAWPVGVTGEDGTLRLSTAGGAAPSLFLFGAAGERSRPALPDAGAEGGPASLRLPPVGEVTGRVVAAESRRPLAGALVWPLYDPGRFVVTGGDGVFRLPGAAAPVADLAVEASGRLPRRVRVGDAESPAVGLERAAEVAGRVLDGEGRPLPGVVVEGRAGEPGRILARGVADAAGNFLLSGLPPGVVLEVAAGLAGYLPATARVTSPAGGAAAPAQRLVLRRGRTAFGRVIDTAEGPLAGARVEARPVGQAATTGSESGAAVLHAETDAEGRFELPALPAARIDLEARAPGYAPRLVRGLAVPPPEGPGGEPGPVDLGTLVLAPGAGLAGRVTGAGGVPLAGAEVRLQPDDGEPPIRLAERLADAPVRATSDAAGHFRIADLTAGRRVHLLVTAESHLPAELPAVPVPGEPVGVALEPATALAGRVETAEGLPVAGAAVLLRAAEPAPGTTGAWHPRPPQEVVTDGAGRFRFAAVAAGRVALEVSAAGHVRSEPLTVDVPLPPAAADEAVVVLRRGVRVEGTVTRAGGDPVSDARIRVGLVRGVTDAEGRFRLDGVEPGLRMLVASHLEYERHVQEVEVKEAGSRFDVVLAGGWPVSGRAVDGDGEPVPGAEVRLIAEPGGEMRLYRAASEADGAFRFPSVVDGRYLLQASAPGFAPRRDTAGPRVAGAAVEDLEVVLLPGTTVEGRLLGLDFDAAAAARVAAEGEGLERVGTVDHEGRFRVADLGPGVWRLRSSAPGGRQAEARVVVELGERRVQRDLRFEGVTLAGRVTHGGEPVAGASLSLAGSGTGAERTGATDWEGRFRLDDLPPDTYLLSVASSREGLLENRELVLASDREIDIEIATRRLAGHVVSAADGRPVRSALVRLQRELGTAAGGASVLTVATDRGGAFEVHRLSAGSYRLTVEADGYVPHQEHLVLDNGAPGAVEVAMEPADTLELVLVGAAAGAQVARLAVLGPDGTVRSQGAYPVEAEGRLRLRRLGAGSWRLLVSTPGSAVAEVDVTVPGLPVELAPPPAARLEVRVPALLEDNAAGELTLWGSGGFPFRGQDPSGAPRTTWLLPGGAGPVDNLPPGSYLLRVSASDGRLWEQPVVLAPGEALTVNLP